MYVYTANGRRPATPREEAAYAELQRRMAESEEYAAALEDELIRQRRAGIAGPWGWLLVCFLMALAALAFARHHNAGTWVPRELR